MTRSAMPSLETLLPASREKGRSHALVVGLLGAVLLALLASFNYLVNPVANFRSFRGLSRMVNQRKVKVDLLRAAQPRPEILILGSSRVRNIDPARVGQAFGAPAFNAGVQNGCPRDWLAFTRYAALELSDPLRFVVVGVDPDNFLRDTVRYNHPAYVDELRRQLHHPFREWLDTRKELLSPYLTEKSWEVLAFRFAGKDTPSEVWAELKRISRNLRRPPPPGKDMTPRADGYLPENYFDDESMIRTSLVQNFAPKNPINPESVEYFEDLAALAAARRFTLVVFIIPMNPWLELHLDRNGTVYRQRLRETRELLGAARDRGAVVCEIDPRGLNFDDYSDHFHPGRKSSEAMIRQLFDCARKAGKI